VLEDFRELYKRIKWIRGWLVDAFHAARFGGTGETVDWDLAALVREQIGGPTILAGGLTPDNVAEAIRKVRPYAVDVSSGVEVSPGIKDPIKVRDFIQAAKGALVDL
jgi:phosphoribosylanthranilate isomerase